MGDETEIVKLIVYGQSKRSTQYRMMRTTKMLKLKVSYSGRIGIHMKSIKFSYQKLRIDDEATPVLLGMKDDDTIYVSFIDEDCYLMEFDPFCIYNCGEVSSTYQYMLELADKDCYLMEFDPFAIHNCGVVSTTYQSMLELAEMTCKLFGVWKKRALAARYNNNQENVRITDYVPFHGFRVNFYQLAPKERDELGHYSVVKLINICGSEEEIVRFEDVVDKIVKFINRCIFNIIESCLPTSLPYPVLSILISYLQAAKGLGQIGQVTKQEKERKCMDLLYLSMADIYRHLKVVMFNTEWQWHNGTPIYSLGHQKKDDLFNRFKVLTELIDRSRPETSEVYQVQSGITDHGGGSNIDGVDEIVEHGSKNKMLVSYSGM